MLVAEVIPLETEDSVLHQRDRTALALPLSLKNLAIPTEHPLRVSDLAGRARALSRRLQKRNAADKDTVRITRHAFAPALCGKRKGAQSRHRKHATRLPSS